MKFNPLLWASMMLGIGPFDFGGDAGGGDAGADVSDAGDGEFDGEEKENG